MWEWNLCITDTRLQEKFRLALPSAPIFRGCQTGGPDPDVTNFIKPYLVGEISATLKAKKTLQYYGYQSVWTGLPGMSRFIFNVFSSVFFSALQIYLSETVHSDSIFTSFILWKRNYVLIYKISSSIRWYLLNWDFVSVPLRFRFYKFYCARSLPLFCVTEPAKTESQGTEWENFHFQQAFVLADIILRTINFLMIPLWTGPVQKSALLDQPEGRNVCASLFSLLTTHLLNDNK